MSIQTAPSTDLLTIELGPSNGDTVWTIRTWSHETAQGAYDMSMQHRNGSYSMHPGHPLGEKALEANLRLALRNGAGYTVLSDSSGRMEEGTRR